MIFIIIDLVIGGEYLADINKVKRLLSGKFEMKDMHELHYFLAISEQATASCSPNATTS